MICIKTPTNMRIKFTFVSMHTNDFHMNFRELSYAVVRQWAKRKTKNC